MNESNQYTPATKILTPIRQGFRRREFDELVKNVKMLHQRLMDMPPVTRDKPEQCSYPGVYLFSVGEFHLYVGRSKNVRKRIQQHTRPSSKDAPLAFLLARKMTGIMKPSYHRKKDSRKLLLKNPTFNAAYAEAKQEIRKMTIRHVETADTTTQALLEIYTATELDAEYNEFRTS
jgi:hypothetical protein